MQVQVETLVQADKLTASCPNKYQLAPKTFGKHIDNATSGIV